MTPRPLSKGDDRRALAAHARAVSTKCCFADTGDRRCRIQCLGERLELVLIHCLELGLDVRVCVARHRSSGNKRRLAAGGRPHSARRPRAFRAATAASSAKRGAERVGIGNGAAGLDRRRAGSGGNWCNCATGRCRRCAGAARNHQQAHGQNWHPNDLDIVLNRHDGSPVEGRASVASALLGRLAKSKGAPCPPQLRLLSRTSPSCGCAPTCGSSSTAPLELPSCMIRATRQVRPLARQLPLTFEARRGQRAIQDRRLDGAARLAAVGAIAESALAGELLDVGEGIRQPFVDIPHAHRPDAWAVEQQRARTA